MAFMAWGFNNLKTLPIDVSINSEKGGHFQFLTIQGLALAFITSGLSAIVDLFPSFQPAIALRRSLLLISLPVSSTELNRLKCCTKYLQLAIVVSSIYWTLLKLFTPLILRSMPVSESAPSHNPHNLPELALIRLPISMDIALHALPAIAMAAEFFIFEKKYSAKAEKYGAPTMAAVYGIGYALWVEYCASFNGRCE